MVRWDGQSVKQFIGDNLKKLWITWKLTQIVYGENAFVCQASQDKAALLAEGKIAPDWP
jgi:hypothetical protein